MVNEHPKLSEHYPAIDGIAKGERPPKEERERIMAEHPGIPVSYRRAERAIRSDVEDVLGMNDKTFDSWYRQRESAILNLLDPLKIATTIPDLRFASEEQRYTLNANAYVSGLYERLEKGLEYLQVIKKVRDDQKNRQPN